MMKEELCGLSWELYSKMSKKILYLLFLLWFFSGCSMKKEAEFELNQLQSEEGLYQYKDISFGSSYEETVEKIPLDFEKVPLENLNIGIYYADRAIEFGDEKASFWIEFSEGKLETVKIQFDLSEGKAEFDEITEELVKLYGKAEKRQLSGKQYKSEVHSWEKDGTNLKAVFGDNGSKQECVIGVFCTEFSQVNYDSVNGEITISFRDFKAGDSYCYTPIPWDTTKEDIEKHMDEVRMEVYQEFERGKVYRSLDTVKVIETREEVIIELEFKDDKLQMVTLIMEEPDKNAQKE